MARLGLVEDHPLLVELLLLDLHQVTAPVESELNDILQQLSVLVLRTEPYTGRQIEPLVYI